MVNRVEGRWVVHGFVAWEVAGSCGSGRGVVVVTSMTSLRLLGGQVVVTAQVEAAWQEPVDGEGVGGRGGSCGRDSEPHVRRLGLE